MYCIHCGVKLADTEKICPLCGTVPYHPEHPRADAIPLYPENRLPKVSQFSRFGSMIILTAAYLLALVISMLANLQTSGAITWSGYVAGAIVLGYVSFALPFWFQRPNPVIFVPSALATAGLYLFYINFSVGGNWFLQFALPILGVVTVIVSTVVTLFRYVRGGRLYILGGAIIGMGALSVLIEFLLHHTFGCPIVGWSVYPLAAFLLVGGTLLFLAICAPVREKMERKFFI